MKTHRIARVNEVIREVAAETILFELRDPRVKHITVTRVDTAADLQSAKIYVSVMGSEKEQLRAVNGLQNAAGFVQSRLAKRLTTRFLPVLTFLLDDGVKKSIEIARILHEERRLAEANQDHNDLPNDEVDGAETDAAPKLDETDKDRTNIDIDDESGTDDPLARRAD